MPMPGQAVVGGVRMTSQQAGMVQTTQAAMAQLASMAQGRSGPVQTQNMMMMRPGKLLLSAGTALFVG